MFISVLISTRDRAQSLRRTLQGIFSPTNLETPDWEVIVVDNGSSDDTPTVCRSLETSFPGHFRSIREPLPGKSNALNSAIRIAKGDILAFTDDDVLCAPDYVQAIRNVFQECAPDGAQGRVFLDCEGGRPEWLDDGMARFMSLQDFGDQVLDWNDNLSGTNMVIRTEVVQKIGGFSPALGAGSAGFGEDSELSWRMRKAGYRLIYAPQIVVRHQIPRQRLTKKSLRQRHFQSGRSIAYMLPLPVPLWRFGLYVLKETLKGELKALWYTVIGRPAAALRSRCDARMHAGTFWQYCLFHLGPTQ